ncbi:MAG: hypothetical protein P8Z38_10340 [Robiginitalea sp.]
MGVLATNTRELKFYYNSASSIGKQALGYIQSSDKKVLAIDVTSSRVTGTQWMELADGLGIGVHELIDRTHPEFIKTYGRNLKVETDRDWLAILEKSPQLLRYPIILNGENYCQIKELADVKIYLDSECTGLERG